jgi:hypothetical protein
MSYCRWSSDEGKSDVYVWHDCSGGWRTWVAEVREDGKPKRLPHDGECFRDRTRRGLLQTLRNLRTLGYHVPDHAIERVMQEIRDTKRAAKRR